MERQQALEPGLDAASAARAWADLERAVGPITLRFDDAAGARMMKLLDGLLEAQAKEGEQAEAGLARLVTFVIEWIEHYDSKVVPAPQLSPVELLTHLMQANGLRQKDLAAELGGQSCVSLVLRGKRPINLNQARALAARFAMKVSAFFPDADQLRSSNVATNSGFRPVALTAVKQAANTMNSYADARAICH